VSLWLPFLAKCKTFNAVDVRKCKNIYLQW